MRKIVLLQTMLLTAALFIGSGRLQKADAAEGVEFKIPSGRTEFSPKNQEIKIGTEVKWINEDGRTHFLTAADPNREEPARIVTDLLIHQLLPPGEVFQMKFDKPNMYDFFCAIHMEMRGTVTVTH